MTEYGPNYDLTNPATFPSEQSRAFDDVKLWFGFNARPYSNRRKLRAKTYTGNDGTTVNQVPGRSIAHTKIYLPMPVNLASKTNISYTAEETTQTALGEALLGADISDNSIVSGFIRGRNLALTTLLGGVGDISSFAAGRGIVTQDNLDATFESALGRTFTFKYTLIAKDADEASLIADICQQFKIFSLPQQTNLPTRVIQPPLWSWDGYRYVNEGGKKSFKKMSLRDNEVWNDNAQTSVLTSVDIDRTGAGGVHPIGVGGGFLPIVTTMTLTFVEIEPLVRLTSGLITNRSGAQLSAQYGQGSAIFGDG
mgnify:CR=1 FL=1